MITKVISEPIEYYVDSQDKYEYRLYLSSDLANTIYEGTVYPFPQFRTSTKKGVIKLNDVMENYVKYDDYILQSPPNNDVHIIPPTRFTLQVYNGTDWTTIQEEFEILNMWLNTNDGFEFLSEIFLLNPDNKDANYSKPFFIPFKSEFVGTLADKLVIEVKTYSNGTLTSTQTVKYVSDSIRNISVLTIKANNTLYRYKTIDGIVMVTDYMEFSPPIPESLYTSGQGYFYSMRVNSCASTYRVYWVNRYGQIEQIEGTYSDKLNTTSNFTDYESDYRTLDGNGEYQGSDGNGGIKRNIVNSTDTFVIKTRLLTTDEHDSLRDLYNSPKVWVYQSGYYYSVLPVDNQYDQHKFQTDKMKNRTITLKKTISDRRR